MVTTRIERLVGYVRRWRTYGDGADQLTLAPGLPDPDLRRLRRVLDQCVEARGGEVAARRKARAVGSAFSTLDGEGRHRFFQLLATDYGGEETAVDTAIGGVLRARSPNERREAEAELRQALEPRRERLFRRFAGLDGGLPFLIGLREELLGLLGRHPELGPVDHDLRRILESWFDVALLRLEQLRWDSPAALLEKLIAYEAVHAIESWDDLKGRLGEGRRCYAFLHPAMGDDPLIFVEVALTQGIADSLPPLLDPASDRTEAGEADSAIFYSISNCHRGLAGVSLGDFLIKSVAEQLSAELPDLQHFATLSPLPGFRRWLERALAADAITIHQAELDDTGLADPTEATGLLAELVAGPVPGGDDPRLDRIRPLLLRLGAQYLLEERRGDGALDPVARFHLSNGASIGRLNWWANPSAAGWERGLGMMVNYRYRLRDIERNHDRYVEDGTVTADDGLRRLLGATDPGPKTA